MSEVVFTDANFEHEVLGSDQPVLVDFWAPWCGPCKIQGPIIDELASEMGDKVKIGKLNVDENPEVGGKFGIMSIPTLIIFQSGKVVEQYLGVQDKDVLRSRLNTLL